MRLIGELSNEQACITVAKPPTNIVPLFSKPALSELHPLHRRKPRANNTPPCTQVSGAEMTSSRRGSTADGRSRQTLPMDQLGVPGAGGGWARRRSDAVTLGDDLMDQLTVPQARWARRPSAVEVIDDGVSGQLVVPIYEEDSASSDGGRSVASRAGDDKPVANIQGVPGGTVSIDGRWQSGSADFLRGGLLEGKPNIWPNFHWTDCWVITGVVLTLCTAYCLTRSLYSDWK